MLQILQKVSKFGIFISSLKYNFLACQPAFSTTKTIFEKIKDKEIPAKILFEDKYCCAINDINPQAPCHILLFPKNKTGLTGIAEANESKQELLGHLLLTAAKVAKQFELANGYRIIINQGEDGGISDQFINQIKGQTIHHLHLHILGGTKLGLTGFK